MYCAECGSKMEQHDHGAWVICCNGWGYWYSERPTAEDQRDYGMPVQFNLPYLVSPGEPFQFWFYQTGKWPRGKTPTKPRT